MGKIKSLFRHRICTCSTTASKPKSALRFGSTSLTSATTSDLRYVFNKFNSNGDGKISSSELVIIFPFLGHPATIDELATMMDEADSDSDIFISFDEFVDLNTIKIDPNPTLEDLKHTFSIFDLNRNGLILAKELVRVFKSLREEVSARKCGKMIQGVDKDGNGFVSFEELKVMIMSRSGFGAMNI